MAIYLNNNPYHGINAHFNSFLEVMQGSWLSFHNKHIADLTNHINLHLPAGYYAVSEHSMQVQTPLERNRSTYPDVGILQQRPAPSAVTATAELTPTLERPLVIEEAALAAVEIYYAETRRLVTRLELLSPTNKLEAREYLHARHKMLERGVNMVDVDYLHYLHSPFEDLPDYPSQQEGAYPYYIVVADRIVESLRFYCWHVDEPLPNLHLPLVGTDKVQVMFDVVYQGTFSTDRRAHMEVDYAQLPYALQTYRLDDQARIHAVMERLKANVQD